MKYFVMGLFFSLNINASCWQDFKADTVKQMQEREKLYQKIDSGFDKFSDLDRAYTTDGVKEELVVLMHGFLANPNEMKSIADSLNQQGYPIYSALIPGYGATATVANQFKNEDWIKWNEIEIARAEKCFSKIHLIGFSTGATIFHDYLTKHNDDSKIASLTLISAFFKTHFMFDMSLKLVKASKAKKMKMGSLLKKLPVSDVQVIVDNPDTYLQEVPLISMREVVELGKLNLKRKVVEKSLHVPTLAIISGEDMIADPDSIEKVVSHNFQNLKMQSYDDPGHIPHQLMLKDISRVSDEVHNQILKFISSN